MEERDLDTLLHKILIMGMQLTDSDGGALLLVESQDGAPPILRPAVHEFNSLPKIHDPEFTLQIDDTSIIGHAAVIKKPVVIDDAYELPAGADYTRNAAFDERYGYRIRSMLIVPMLDHRARLVGVLVLVNRVSDRTARITSKAAADRFVLRYSSREVRLARSLAGQAAVSIENAKLYAQIERIFESFVKARSRRLTIVTRRRPDIRFVSPKPPWLSPRQSSATGMAHSEISTLPARRSASYGTPRSSTTSAS